MVTTTLHGRFHLEDGRTIVLTAYPCTIKRVDYGFDPLKQDDPAVFAPIFPAAMRIELADGSVLWTDGHREWWKGGPQRLCQVTCENLVREIQKMIAENMADEINPPAGEA
jgi:hypothetical protein